MSDIKYGFAPVYDRDSKILILGSFPSVKSREAEFYYGNPLNRFWKTLGTFFGDTVPQDTQGRRDFLLKRKVALWDVVAECEIVGSQDSTIKNFKVADVKTLLQNSAVRFIILNGAKAFTIFERYFPDTELPYIKLPSTSPANTRFNDEEWYDALSTVFDRT